MSTSSGEYGQDDCGEMPVVKGVPLGTRFTLVFVATCSGGAIWWISEDVLHARARFYVSLSQPVSFVRFVAGP